MTVWIPNVINEKVNLQSTLAAATSDTSLLGKFTGTHHPIACANGELYLDEDNTMRCNHSSAPPENPRNQAILDASIAILIFQEVAKKFGDHR